MDELDVLPFLADSPPCALLGVLVFLLLTRPRQWPNRESRKTGGTGRHSKGDGPAEETESEAAEEPPRS
jgi:hypothetical protein